MYATAVAMIVVAGCFGQTIKCWIIGFIRSICVQYMSPFALEFLFLRPFRILYAKLSWQNDCRLEETGRF